jgi:hypothetical protein
MAQKLATTKRACDDREARFARNLIAGMNQQMAMIEAGYSASSARSNMGALVQRRQYFIDEMERLRAVQHKRLAVTIDTIIIELYRDRDMARRLEQPAVAAGITMHMAKVLGFLEDRQQVDITIINKPLAVPTKELELSVDEWIARWSPKEIGHG